ncbi:histidine kinase [Microbacterium caowuchunii]|nr:histidine kinase [Microbacterium caowuchunii]
MPRTSTHPAMPDAGHRNAVPHPAWFTLCMRRPSRSDLAGAFRAALVPLLVLAVGIGYVGVQLSGGMGDDPTPSSVPAGVHGAIVALQAGVLLFRRRAPILVLTGVVLLDLVILATSAGQLGIGALAVTVATYGAVRHGGHRGTAYAAVAGTAVATALVGTFAMASGGDLLSTTLLVAAARLVLLSALPAATAEYVVGRERLARAMRDQEEAAERERSAAAERTIRAERTALARELHDIAGHHLSGIIVSAQAASALTRTDPDRARETLRALQQNARTALADLRRTVGLLRDDDEESSPGAAPGTVPALAEIPALAAAARERGQDVRLQETGRAEPLGPLAETAGYRMVQESLANAARHAPGTVCRVSVNYRPEGVELLVVNGPGRTRTTSPGAAAGYGIAGMRERADLVGGRLETGPRPDGGWRNRLTIPMEREGDAT